jgi:hypothetical protein
MHLECDISEKSWWVEFGTSGGPRVDDGQEGPLFTAADFVPPGLDMNQCTSGLSSWSSKQPWLHLWQHHHDLCQERVGELPSLFQVNCVLHRTRQGSTHCSSLRVQGATA